MTESVRKLIFKETAGRVGVLCRIETSNSRQNAGFDTLKAKKHGLQLLNQRLVENFKEKPMITQPPIPSTPLTPSTPPKSKKTLLLIISALMLVAILTAAAFLAGRLMNRKPSSQQPQILGGTVGDGPFTIAGGLESSGVVVGEQTIGLDFQPAKELPTTPPVTAGLFTRRLDNSIFVGTGMSVSVMTADTGGDAQSPVTSYDGPEVEVVITKETLIYRDVTKFDLENPSAAVQQELEPGSLEDLNSQNMVSVWGQKTGDRLVAEVILFTLPMLVQMPSP